MEAIFEALIYFVLVFPGAFIRWLFLGKKKSFKEVLADEVYWNVTIGILVLIPIVILLIALL